MKTFKFEKKDNAKVIYAMRLRGYRVPTDKEVMGLSKIKKYYGSKANIYIYKNYIDKCVYAMYDNDNTILEFNNEEEAYRFIFTF